MIPTYIEPTTKGADALSAPASLALGVLENDERSMQYQALLEAVPDDKVIMNQAGETIPLNLQAESTLNTGSMSSGADGG